MVDIERYYIPVLAGLIFITTFTRFVRFWQMERTPRVFFFFIVFLDFCCIYLASAMGLPFVYRDVLRVILVVAFVLGDWYCAKEVIEFLHEKDKKKKAGGSVSSPAATAPPAPAAPVVPPPERMTIKEIIDSPESVALEGTLPKTQTTGSASSPTTQGK